MSVVYVFRKGATVARANKAWCGKTHRLRCMFLSDIPCMSWLELVRAAVGPAGWLKASNTSAGVLPKRFFV